MNHEGDNVTYETDEWIHEEKCRTTRFQGLMKKLHKGKDLKNAIRGGIPDANRHDVWIKVSGGKKLCKKNINFSTSRYIEETQLADINENTFGLYNDITSIIPEDKKTSFLKILSRIYQCKQDKINTAPLIPITAAYLLQKLNPVETFYSLLAMINHEDSFYFTETNKKFIASMEAVDNLISIKFPNVMKQAKFLGMKNICMYVLPKFFLPPLNMNISLTIFDLFISEGRKIMVRMTLALISFIQNELCHAFNPEQFKEIINDAILDMKTVSKMKTIIRTGFGIHLSRTGHILVEERKSIGQIGQNGSLPSYYNQYVWCGACKASTMTMQPIQRHRIRITDLNPKIKQLSGLMSIDDFEQIRNYMSAKYNHYIPNLIFRMSTDGTTFVSLFSKCRGRPQILLIKTQDQNGKKIIGAFLPESLSPVARNNYYLQYLTVFDLTNKEFYGTVCIRGNLMAVTHDSIQIGNPQPAIAFYDGFSHVFSSESDTFNSPYLVEGGMSQILDVELYNLDIS